MCLKTAQTLKLQNIFSVGKSKQCDFSMMNLVTGGLGRSKIISANPCFLEFPLRKNFYEVLP